MNPIKWNEKNRCKTDSYVRLTSIRLCRISTGSLHFFPPKREGSCFDIPDLNHCFQSCSLYLKIYYNTSVQYYDAHKQQLPTRGRQENTEMGHVSFFIIFCWRSGTQGSGVPVRWSCVLHDVLRHLLQGPLFASGGTSGWRCLSSSQLNLTRTISPCWDTITAVCWWSAVLALHMWLWCAADGGGSACDGGWLGPQDHHHGPLVWQFSFCAKVINTRGITYVP